MVGGEGEWKRDECSESDRARELSVKWLCKVEYELPTEAKALEERLGVEGFFGAVYSV